MNPDPLADLRDWHLPDPLSWWPPAPGWWILLGLAVLAMVAAFLWIRRLRRRGRAWRAAKRELVGLRAAYESDRDGRRFIAELSRLLRRLALLRYPRERVAGLSGSAWLEFLDATGGAGGFVGGAGRILMAAYRADAKGVSEDEVAGLARLAETWMAANEGGRP
ncbi:DUF4381 domain-containing protein [Thiorhodococcus mannitoliphagus]|uniref:DUF4381 domain-containing protein n=1 Tax=Thiorhodococcus mannitoliphagus TaxID=329406 RepID=A0A6P1E058_9GAMM|nr:DUF4381 domain-containing protein [Thiorhodococcus mannitoliphagus]NEX21145.1 DUF4381 domain-containing protein [Thiorhodococcus mannitoliphagus]